MRGKPSSLQFPCNFSALLSNQIAKIASASIQSLFTLDTNYVFHILFGWTVETLKTASSELSGSWENNTSVQYRICRGGERMLSRRKATLEMLLSLLGIEKTAKLPQFLSYSNSLDKCIQYLQLDSHLLSYPQPADLMLIPRV